MSDLTASLIAKALRAAADVLDPSPAIAITAQAASAAASPTQVTLSEMLGSCVIEKIDETQAVVNRIIASKDKYAAVEKATGVPWFMVAVIHSLESDLDFTTHLHNGDPLNHRTVNDPSGRPSGNPPFSWIESAIDALQYDKVEANHDWSAGACLDKLERYNGLGYRQRGVPSPYLWAGTNHYTAGKYVADHRFDPNAVSHQIGGGALIKDLEHGGFIQFV